MKAYLYQKENNKGIPVACVEIEGKVSGPIDDGDVYLHADFRNALSYMIGISGGYEVFIELKEGSDQDFANLKCLHDEYFETNTAKRYKK